MPTGFQFHSESNIGTVPQMVVIGSAEQNRNYAIHIVTHLKRFFSSPNNYGMGDKKPSGGSFLNRSASWRPTFLQTLCIRGVKVQFARCNIFVPTPKVNDVIIMVVPMNCGVSFIHMEHGWSRNTSIRQVTCTHPSPSVSNIVLTSPDVAENAPQAGE